MNDHVFYSAQSAASAPGPMAALLDDLPLDIRTLCAVVHGLIVLELVDRVADVTASNPVPFPVVTTLYRALLEVQVGNTVKSYTIDGPKFVELLPS